MICVFVTDTEIYGLQSDISGNPVLFTLSVPREPRMFCIRMDVDGILWSFSNQDNEPVFHKATFNALGYVQVLINLYFHVCFFFSCF